MHLKRLGLLITVVCSMLFASQGAFAEVVFEEDYNIYLESLDLNLRISRNSSVDTIVIADNYVTITKGTGDRVIVYSFDKINLQNDAGLTVRCFPDAENANYTQLDWTTSDAVTITPPSTANHCESTDAVSANATGGGGGGQTVSVAVPTEDVRPAGEEETPPEQQETPPEQVTPEEHQAAQLELVPDTLQLADVHESSALYQPVVQLFAIMLEHKTLRTFRHDQTVSFRRGQRLTLSDLARSALALQERGCEGGLSNSDCQNAAREHGIIPREIRRRVPQRIEIYEVLLNALNVEFEEEEVSVSTLNELCIDADGLGSLNDAEKIRYGKIMQAAFARNIPTRFGTVRCQLEGTIRKSEFAQISGAVFAARET
ncbi:hypothetical protein COV82_00055 [Candidatus Peregrinibacteria bacterium CG11_big_fil_rev_8_21_14_0_20_46_8]|nr:MAG: hypothetical protein COV82_00055 [Candidatus Peregrinibacteria bacterium CG11_big_fil_rev_8_21_14_0_20_46_8]